MQVTREIVFPDSPDEVWEAVTGDGWLADEVEMTLDDRWMILWRRRVIHHARRRRRRRESL